VDQTNNNLMDEEIIQSILQGNKEMYSLLVNRYQMMILRYAFFLCKNKETASDLAQETFITAYDTLDRIKVPAAFPGWLMGILRNKYRNLGREHKIPTISLSELGLDIPDSGQPTTYTEEQLEKISKYVHSLPKDYQDVILLKYLQEFSYKEIANILNISITTVTGRLTHARQFLIKKAREDGLV
jgi:RNA polymerase sigma-70 factor (ECF subfamily)